MKRSSNRPVDGAHKEFFAGGAISAEGLLRNGKRHGKWKYYYRNGRPKAVGKYVYGEFDGGWEWWRENGQSLQVGAFKNGKQVGLWKRTTKTDNSGMRAHTRTARSWRLEVYDKAGVLKQSKVFKAKR